MKNKFKAFTLIELVVTISIIAIMAIGINNISLNNISEAQKVGIFYNKIKNNIESTINYSLIGRAVDSNMNVPEYWKININNNNLGAGFGTGEIIVSFFNGTLKTHTGFTVKSPNFYSINDIQCIDLQNNKTTDNNVELLIKNGNITINGCPNTNDKIVEFNLIYKKYSRHISINSVNNVIN